MTVDQPAMSADEEIERGERGSLFKADIFQACVIDTKTFHPGMPGVLMH